MYSAKLQRRLDAPPLNPAQTPHHAANNAEDRPAMRAKKIERARE
jgi:hypothetical protein